MPLFQVGRHRLREVEAPASGHTADGRSRAWTSSWAPHFLVPRLQPSCSQTPIWLERCFVWPTLLLKEKKDDIGRQHLNGQIYIQIWISGWQFGGCAWQPPAWGCPVQEALLVIRPPFSEQGFPAVRPRAGDLASPGVGLLICKMGMIIALAVQRWL